MALQHVNDAKHWRGRAAEMRVLSDDVKDSKARSMLLRLANDYEKLADRAEDRATRENKLRPSPIAKNA
jgi:hypothetical protein